MYVGKRTLLCNNMLKFYHLFICCLTTFAVATVKVETDCSIKLTTDVTSFSPVILTSPPEEDYQLFKPSGKVTKFTEGTLLLLACAGKTNVFEKQNFNILKLKCSKGNFEDSNGKVQKLNKFACKSVPISSLRVTKVNCLGGKGLIYESGFTVKDQFYGPVFQICYDDASETVLYTQHTLNGAAMKYSVSESSRRSFAADGMHFTTTKVNSFYKKQSQITRFENYFGADQTYVDEKNFLARGHLAPDADFILPYEQLATYYYANVAPEFQVVNAGNWLRVEELARAVSASFEDDIESYNGYMDVLSLPDDSGDLVDIYLDDAEKIEVPNYYFKVLLHRPSDSAIVFVTVNNPYIEDVEQEEICTNVCKQSGLEHANFPDVGKGFTFCCELNEFKLLVESLPDELTASNLLKRKSV